MAFLGNFFTGFRNALIKCVGNSVTPKEVSTHYDEKEEKRADSIDDKEEANKSEATPNIECVGIEGSPIDSTVNNNLKQSCLEVISAASDVPSDFSSSYEKIGDDSACHGEPKQHDLFMEEIFQSPENRQLIKYQDFADIFKSLENHHVPDNRDLVVEETFLSPQNHDSAQEQGVRSEDTRQFDEKPVAQESCSPILESFEDNTADEVDGSDLWTFEICWKLTDVMSPFTRSDQSHYVFFGIIPRDANEFEKTTAELDELTAHTEDTIGCAVSAVKQRGYEVAVYKLHNSRSLAILFNLNSAHQIVERYRFELQRDVGISLPHEDSSADDAIAFGYLVAEFIAQFSQVTKVKAENAQETNSKRIRVISHDWSETIGLVLLHLWKVETEKVFKPNSNVAAFSTNVHHRMKIEQLAREIASEDINVQMSTV